MGKIQDMKHLEVMLDRYVNFKMDDLTIGHIVKNIFTAYPVSENMRDNLNLAIYKKDKKKFLQCLTLEKEYLQKKATNIGTDGFMAQMIFVKLANLIAKIEQSEVFKK